MSEVKEPKRNFMYFVRTQGVVGLAVGLAIGTQVGKVVEAIVTGFINPLVAFIIGNQSGLQAAKWTIYKNNHPGGRVLIISWGQVFSAVITLLAVSAVIYYIVHGLRLDRVDSKKDEAK